jgi:phosphate-selective porin OprO/OprP
MRFHVPRLALCLLAAFALCAPAAHADDDWSTKWSNGFKVESKDKKFKLKFGGRIQADYTFASGDSALEDNLESGFEFRRARLFFSGTIYERVSFKAQYDFAGGETAVKDLWIGLDQDWGQVRFGHFKEYFSLEEQTSSKYLAFIERSLPIEAFSPGRNSGIGVHGASGETLNWGVGAFYDADDFGVSTNEDNINITGRVGWRPIYEDDGKTLLHVALAASRKDIATGGTFRFRARPEAHFTTRFVDTKAFAADSSTLLGAEVAGVFNRFWFAAEYAQNSVDAPAVGDPTFDGYYAQVGYFLTDDYRRFKGEEGAFDRQKPNSTWGKDGGSGAWEIALRASSLNLNDAGITGGEQDNYTLAVNWYPNPATRLMLNFVKADITDVGDANFVIMRWQVDF